MYLVKYTSKRWRDAAVNQTSLRIGSVLHYREIEDQRFRDENEGDGRIVYQSKTPLTSEVHNRIFEGQPYKLNDGWTIDTGGVPLLSEPSQFNAFVFSCSLLKRNHEIQKQAHKFKSNAWYFIKNPMQFADEIAAKLKKYLAEVMPTGYLPESVRKKMHLLEVLPVFGPIHYTDKPKDQVVDDGNFESFHSKQFQLNAFFQKHPKFQEEKEFRFIWLINLGNSEKDDFDLTTTTIRTVDLTDLLAPISAKPVSLNGINNRRGRRIV